MLRHLSTLLILLFLAPDTHALLPVGQFDEAQLLPILKETLYQSLGLKYVPDFLKQAQESVAISARQKAAVAQITFDPSPCTEEHLAWDDEWFEIHPFSNPYFYKPHFKQNWDLLWKNADEERKGRTCIFLREAAKILNVGWRSGKDGQPSLTPKTLEWLEWMGMQHPYAPGQRFYGDGHQNHVQGWEKGCMMMGSHYRLTNPSVIKNMGLRDYTLEDYHIELKSQEKTHWNDQKLQNWLELVLDHEPQSVITPELEIYPGVALLRSAEGFGLFEVAAKPWIDSKKCVKLSQYPLYNEVSVEIDTYLTKQSEFFYGLSGMLAPANGTGPDMNYTAWWHNSNNNRKFPLENRDTAHYADAEHEYMPEANYLQHPNIFLYWDENSQEYKHSNWATTQLARFGMTTELDFISYYDIETANDANSTIYSYWNWGKNLLTKGKFGKIEWGHCVHQIIYFIGHRLAYTVMGPFTGKYGGDHFGNYEVNNGNRSWPSYEDGVIYGGNDSWPLTWPIQTDFARYSQKLIFQSSNKTLEEQLAIWNDQEFMKGGDNTTCGDFEVPEPWTNLMDIMPFWAKYVKYYWMERMASFPKIHSNQGCRFLLFQETAGTIAFHKKLGFSHEVALARAILFDSVSYMSINAGIGVCNLVFMLLGSNIFFTLIVMMVLAWLTLKLTIKFCLMIGFDIVKLGKMVDDREFYAKNNAGETMNAIWPSAHPGKTNHEDYAWDMPEVLQRPQGGEYVYHTDIFLMSANDMVNKPVRTAPFPTAQSYLDMGHAKGSREDIQSLVALCFIVGIYAYILFTVGRYKQLWDQQ